MTNNYLKLSAQRALLGEITPNMLAVSLEVIENRLRIKFDFDSEPSEDDEEAVRFISGEILADFPAINQVEEIIDFGKSRIKDDFLDCLVYLSARGLTK